jgi:hypothetical protein
MRWALCAYCSIIRIFTLSTGEQAARDRTASSRR